MTTSLTALAAEQVQGAFVSGGDTGAASAGVVDAYECPVGRITVEWLLIVVFPS